MKPDTQYHAGVIASRSLDEKRKDRTPESGRPFLGLASSVELFRGWGGGQKLDVKPTAGLGRCSSSDRKNLGKKSPGGDRGSSKMRGMRLQ
jgi:hypothetical protein